MEGCEQRENAEGSLAYRGRYARWKIREAGSAERLTKIYVLEPDGGKDGMVERL